VNARIRIGAILALCLGLGACHGPAADDDAAFGKRVRAYLLAHPEVLSEASERLEAKAAAEDEARVRQARARLPGVRMAVEHDPRDFVANPAGKVTVTEFYDYRCPHCVGAAPKVLALIAARPDVRFVFKEAPIFGPVSEHAARAALAVRKAGGDSLGLYKAFMSAPALNDATIDAIARQKGAKPADLKPAPDTSAHLADTQSLFETLDLQGTPAFIVGDQVFLGEDVFPALIAAIDRAGGASH
jgi:protein-disulfide isomerase